ncbi:MAG: hypothetical protein A3J63_01385 [Candidatus Moranbacteria bacterium RIFCSPHIGHO2_02_FULL_40_12b]|nr:MAG: hypothetical protein A3J63_01385 [Candidatus Moranbacteria bacterium RIFCSPHIGHO2_02_FULL_40_12b]OGI22747.1 MAG: hypothetical protein A3E91_02605 [Candidatus Moranbacteria bacterium RIFCSPHIGHO2_12_FULL_40_10]
MKKIIVTFPKNWKFSFSLFGKIILIVEKDAVKTMHNLKIKTEKISNNTYSLKIPISKKNEILEKEFINNLRKTGLNIIIK